MAEYYKLTREQMWGRIKKWNYDYDTATYQLLLAKKKRGLPVKLDCNIGNRNVRLRLLVSKSCLIFIYYLNHVQKLMKEKMN